MFERPITGGGGDDDEKREKNEEEEGIPVLDEHSKASGKMWWEYTASH